MPEQISRDLRESARTPTVFSRVYEAMGQDLLVFLVRRTFDVEAARDLTAETFAQAFEHRGRFRGSTDAEAAAWLYAIARHQLARYARKGVTERRAIRRLGMEVAAVSFDDHARIVDIAGLTDLRRSVVEAFSALPADQRDALRLRVVDEYPYDHVAATLGISEETARARVSRALRRIADRIDMTPPVEASS